jgi:hypothetical protein
MKNYSLGLFTFVSILILISCSKDNPLEDQREIGAQAITMTEKSLGISVRPIDVNCGNIDLIAGQHTNAGMINITADDDNVYVTYQTDADWFIGATHLYIGDCDLIPTNISGNPKIGHFPNKSTHASGTNEVIYTISKDDLESNFCVAAHAEVSQISPSGNVIRSETAWGEGFSFGGSSWAMFQEVEITGCYFRPDEPIVRR